MSINRQLQKPSALQIQLNPVPNRSSQPGYRYQWTVVYRGSSLQSGYTPPVATQEMAHSLAEVTANKWLAGLAMTIMKQIEDERKAVEAEKQNEKE